MGTMIQRYELQERDYRGERFLDHPIDLKGNNDVLVLTQPQIIAEVHRAYLEAGADIIETCSFSANALSQAEYSLERYISELNRASVAIAKAAVEEFSLKDGKPRFVAASVGPTSISLSIPAKLDDPIMREYDFDAMASAYYEQLYALIEAGADLILLETCFDALNTKAAGYAARKVMRDLERSVPLMISATIADSAGRLLTGQSLEAFVVAVEHLEPAVLSVNCGFGAEELLPFVERLSACAPCAVACYPNAGLPDASGEYHDDALMMAELLCKLARRGKLNVAGACCGSTPEYIAVMAQKLQGISPRQVPKSSAITQFSGLNVQACEASKMLWVAERSNVAGSQKFRRLIAENKEAEALAVTAQQMQAGAQMIDICMDDAMIDAKRAMQRFLRLIAGEPEISQYPLVIDSSNFELIKSALKECQGKCLVNSISLKEGETLFLEHARWVRDLGAAIVIMAFDEEGQASTTQRRIEILQRAIELLKEKANFPEQEIVVDPNILAVGTGLAEHRTQAISFIESCKILLQKYPKIQTIGGLSNLSFAFRGNNTVREAIHSVFLDLAKDSLSMVIANPQQKLELEDIDAELRELIVALLMNTEDAVEEKIMRWAAKNKAQSSHKRDKSDADLTHKSLVERIYHSFLRADTKLVSTLMAEALAKHTTALAVIEGPLMQAMSKIGAEFSKGELFLPQIVKSARVLKEAISYLPLDESSASARVSKKKILLATVKGDVHDIGKNIVKIVLQCNGYEVLDLGVMTPTEDIVHTAIAERVDAIGLSGLISPSLLIMQELAVALSEASCSVPLWVGGAATSKTHAAVHLAPQYRGYCDQIGDASTVPVVLAELFGAQASDFLAKTRNEQAKLREEYYSQTRPRLLSLEDARARVKLSPAPTFSADLALGIYDVLLKPSDLRDYIPWAMLSHSWKLLRKTKNGAAHNEAQKLENDVERALLRLEALELGNTNLRYAICKAQAINEDIRVLHDEREYILHFIRCQEENSQFLCLSDFLAKDDFGALAPFVVSCKIHSEALLQALAFIDDSLDYVSLLLQSTGQLLAEAASRYFGKNILAPLGKHIRPSVGYPIYPDHSEKQTLFTLLRAHEIGIELSESYMMKPGAAICALGIWHPEASYFNPRYVSKEQVENYAQRKQISVAEAKRQMAVLDFEAD